ncbi:MAG: hypothetical protein IJL63_05965 [Clostridia bacterium]|nr:hypothetical protein [Clostridia bacterium]
MTEQQGKHLIKLIIDNGFPKLKKLEKEAYKLEVDNADSFEKLLAITDNIIRLSNSRN